MRMSIARAAALPVALLAASVLVAQPSGAATTVKKNFSKNYELAGDRVTSRVVLRSDPTCDGGECQLASDGTVEAGGVSFDPTASRGTKRYKSVTIKVFDDVDMFGHVSVRVCESQLRTTCTGADSEFNAYACLARGEPFVVRDTLRTNYIIVMVYNGWSCTQYVNDLPADQGGGTSGRITAKMVYVN